MRTPLAPAALVFLAALPGSAGAAVIGGPLLRDGMSVVPSYQTGVQVDRMMAPAGSIHLEAAVHATAGEAHGFAPGAWIPYLTINYALTRDDMPAFKKSGLLYPMVSRDGPHYAGAAEIAGPGTYHLIYIISPPPPRACCATPTSPAASPIGGSRSPQAGPLSIRAKNEKADPCPAVCCHARAGG